MPGVMGLHDLHARSLSSRVVALTAYVDTDGSRPDGDLLREACTMLRERFAIGHATLQLEPAAGAVLDTAARGATVGYVTGRDAVYGAGASRLLADG